MRRTGVVVGIVVAAMLAGCASPGGGGAVNPDGTVEPSIEYAPVGSAAIPVGCAELLSVADVASISPAGEPPMADVIDENRIAQDMSVAQLQAGSLRCIWSNNYGGTDFNRTVRLTVSPSTATTLDPATEPENYFGSWSDAGEEQPTLISCQEGGGLGGCLFVQLRAGYRIDLSIDGVDAPTLDALTSLSRGLLATVGAAVDAAGAPQSIAPTPDIDIATLCAAPEVTSVIAARGGSGAPSVAANPSYPAVIDCSWEVANPDGSPYPEDYTVTVSVLPGGAWAVDRIASGVGAYGNNYRPASDGDYLVSEGFFGLGAFRSLGNDLIQVSAPYRDGDPDAWVQQLAAAW